MEHVLKYVKKVVNFIRSRGLNHQFSGLLKNVGSEFEGLPYMQKLIRLFLEMKGESVNDLYVYNWLLYLPFMVDMTGYLNDLNLKLQRKDQLVISIRCTFNVNDLINEFKSRFEDFKASENDFSLFSDPFSFVVQKADGNVQMALIDIQCDTVLKYKFNEVGIPKFYSYLPSHCSEMCQFATRILAVFGSTYRCEQLFSLMKANKTSHRSRLTTQHLSSILKIASQNVVADIETLISI
ncbi:hypothetical protein PR048_003292 [Dryococelus australis]|uniref:Uncharacterized protein n=1 Tax=Dryococelus australis TaxID=614101 RepID=A0ABQ9IMP4_9NEOP|nr:hypothetical protein PR048_003292 [Dryococelus australis]